MIRDGEFGGVNRRWGCDVGVDRRWLQLVGGTEATSVAGYGYRGAARKVAAV